MLTEFGIKATKLTIRQPNLNISKKFRFTKPTESANEIK
jgi:hypothetical protein